MSYLFVCQKLDTGVWKNAEQRCRMSTKETAPAILPVYTPHSSNDAYPRAGVFGELGIGGLEEDLYAVERRNDGFSLQAPCQFYVLSRIAVTRSCRTAHPAIPPATPDLTMYSQLRFSNFFCPPRLGTMLPSSAGLDFGSRLGLF
jgi:hypothetical protein